MGGFHAFAAVGRGEKLHVLIFQNCHQALPVILKTFEVESAFDFIDQQDVRALCEDFAIHL